MLSFNLFKVIFLTLFFMSSIVSCSFWSPDNKNGSAQNSNFSVTNVKFEGSSYSIATSNLKGHDTNKFKLWKLPYINKFTYSACLIETTSRASVKNKKFVVLDESGEEVAVAKTDNKDGCLNWEEPYLFNYLAPTYSLRLTRQIKGLGLYEGTFTYQVHINPWAKRNNSRGESEKEAVIPQFENTDIDEVKLLTNKKDIADALVGAYNYKEEKDGLLFSDSFNYQISAGSAQKNPEAVKAHNLSLKASNLYTSVRSLSDNNLVVNLGSGGAFSLNARLVEVSSISKEFFKPLTEFHPASRFNSNKEFLASSVKLPHVFLNSMGPIENIDSNSPKKITPYDYHIRGTALDLTIPVLYEAPKKHNKTWVFIELYPINFPFSGYLQFLKGSYEGEGADSGKANYRDESSHNLFTKKKSLSSVEGFVATAGAEEQSVFDLIMGKGTQKLKLSGRELKSELFIRDEVKPKYFGTISGESVTYRGIRYTVKPCVRLTTNNQVELAEEEVEVSVYNLSVGSDISFLDKDKKRSLKKRFVVKTDHKGCVTVNDDIWYRQFSPEKYLEYQVEIKQTGSDHIASVHYIINPWDEGWTFSLDRREADRGVLAENRDGIKIKSRLFVPKFSYETLRFKYNIDKYLNLNVLKQVLFNITPTTLRYNSNKSGRFGIYQQRDGIYLMKAAMEKNYLDPSSKGIWIRDDQKVSYSTKEGETKNYHPSYFISCPENSSTKECLENKRKRTFMTGAFGGAGKIKMKRHLDVVSRLVRVVGGQIIAPVAFEVPDIRVMRLRSNLFIQIEPVDEWRLWMAQLYYNFYENIYKHVNKGKELPPQLIIERQKNIKHIISAMENNPRFIHNSIYVKKRLDKRLSHLDKNGHTIKGFEEFGTFKGKQYQMCKTPENVPVTWDEIFMLFGFSPDGPVKKEVFKSNNGVEYSVNKPYIGYDAHALLRKEVSGGDILAFVKEELPSYDNSFLNEKSDGTVCMWATNVIKDLLINDPKEVRLNPFNTLTTENIQDELNTDSLAGLSLEKKDELRLSDFIDKNSGLEQSTFFGPMTFLNNGNSSNMRPTSNISEYVCISGDCDENKNETDLVNNLSNNSSDFELKQKLNKNFRSFLERFNLLGKTDDLPDYRETARDDDGNELPNPAARRRGRNKAERVGYDMNAPDLLQSANANMPNDSYQINFLPSGRSVYDVSRYFGDLSYANNLLIYNYESDNNPINDCSAGRKPIDLESEMFCLKKIARNENEIRSKLYYYLNNFNLMFTSLGNEEVKFFNPTKKGCESSANLKYGDLVNETKCFTEDKGYVDTDFKNKIKDDPELKNSLIKMIQSLTIDDRTAQIICRNMLTRFKDLNFKGSEELKARYDRIDFTSTKKGSVFRACVTDLVQQVSVNPGTRFDRITGEVLDVERKVRVLKTGAYAFKGGKALNINVSNQVGLGHSSSYGFSAGKGISAKDALAILGSMATVATVGAATVANKASGEFFENSAKAAVGLVYGDEKWSTGDSNSLSEGTSIAEGTFLVMQNATVDVKLTDYYQCVSITFGRKFQKAIGIDKRIRDKEPSDFLRLVNKTLENPMSDNELLENRKFIENSFLNGMFICDRSERDKATDPQYGEVKELPIRENFYYFTQHFTEGDMLDSGDMSNHPWLKAIRGKTDMWRFLAQIRNQDISLKSEEDDMPFDKYLPQLDYDKLVSYLKNLKYVDAALSPKTKGKMNLGDEWPIYQLVKAYHGTIPSFPGVYSAINSPCNYSLDFPWGDNPIDSFNPQIIDEFLAEEESIQKFTRSAFSNDNDPSVELPELSATDADISKQALERAIRNNYESLLSEHVDAAPKNKQQVEKALSQEGYRYYDKNIPIGLFYDDFIENEALNSKIKRWLTEFSWKKDGSKSNIPSKTRIEACPGYM